MVEMSKLLKYVKPYIVSIQAQSYLTTLASTDPTPVNFATNTIIFNHPIGGGVIMLGGRILCASETVLIPPLQLASRNRFPFTAAVVPAPTGVAPDQPVIASRITATIEIPCKCCSCDEYNPECDSCCTTPYEYLVRVLAINGAEDLALLEIDNLNEFNGVQSVANPAVGRDGLVLGRAPKNGDSIHVIGYTNSNDRSFGGLEVKSVNPGTVSKDRYMDPSGWVLPELTLLSVPGVYNNQVGSAVIDNDGRLIGLVVTTVTGTVVTSALLGDGIPANIANSNYNQGGLPHTYLGSGEGRVSAIHVHQLRQFLRALRYDECSGSLETSSASFIPISDAYHGTYSRYVRAYLGIGYRQTKGTDSINNIDFTGIVTNNPGFEYPVDLTGTVPTAHPKVVDGIIVTSVAGDSAASLPSHLTPSQAQAGIDGFPVIIADSPLLGIVRPGDKIISFEWNNSLFEVGGQDCERAPDLFLSRVVPGETIIVNHISASTVPKFDIQYLVRTPVVVGSYPSFLDFPYAAARRYPNYITVTPPSFPGFEPSI